MLTERREKFKFISERVGLFFSKSKIHPNFFTLVSLLFGLLCFIFLVKNNLILGIFFFLLASFSDFIDGAVARAILKATKIGAYLDTICDRYVEAMFLAGFLFLPLPDVFLPASVWIFLCIFGALMTTYSKAAAIEKRVIREELKRGLLGRPERLILIFLIMVLGILNLYWSVYLLIIFAIFSNLTALQRISFVLKK